MTAQPGASRPPHPALLAALAPPHLRGSEATALRAGDILGWQHSREGKEAGQSPASDPISAPALPLAA